MFDASNDRVANAGTDKAEFHGGDLGAAEKQFGRPPDGWLDLSTGINPRPYPVGAISDDAWARLPDAAAIAELKTAAAAYFGVPAACGIVPAPGTQSLIQWLPRLRPPGRVAVVGPTYGEHAHAWRLAGHDVFEIADLDDIPPGTAALVLVNPNNPDGRRWPPERLAKSAAQSAAAGGWLVVDEAFADPEPELSAVPQAAAPGIVVLRSFGKFFGLPGIRLGFAVAETGLAETISAAMGPWAVSGPAIAAATAAYRDENWIAATRRRLAHDGGRLADLLARSGLRIVGRTPLFCLAEADDSEAVYDRLGRAGIYVRRFSDRSGWLRFGLPGSENDFRRLAAALGRGDMGGR